MNEFDNRLDGFATVLNSLNSQEVKQENLSSKINIHKNVINICSKGFI